MWMLKLVGSSGDSISQQAGRLCNHWVIFCLVTEGIPRSENELPSFSVQNGIMSSSYTRPIYIKYVSIEVFTMCPTKASPQSFNRRIGNPHAYFWTTSPPPPNAAPAEVQNGVVVIRSGSPHPENLLAKIKHS